MAVDTCDKANTKKEVSSAASRFALVFDFEEVVLPVHQAEFDALRHILESRKVTLTPALYARHALCGEPRQYLPGLLKALGVRTNAVDTMAEEVRMGIHMFLASPEVQANTFVCRLIQVACIRGLSCVLRTRFTEAEVCAMLANKDCALETLPVLTVATDAAKHEPEDGWRTVIKTMQRTPSNIVAVVSSQSNLRAALAVGLRGIAVPDPFTAFQDFSGADCVIDDPSEWESEAFLDRWK